MSLTDPRFDLGEFQAELGAASAALQDFAQGPAKRAADDVGVSFERAGVRIARALGSAALGGENAFRRMAKVILEELAKIALQQIFAPQPPKQSDGSKFAGFTPDFGGLAGAQGVSVHFHLGGGADPNVIARHQGPDRRLRGARGRVWEAQSVSAFHEVLLPLPFALGASGGPERRVDIVALGSGREARNTPWAHGRRRYDIGGAVRTLDELHTLIAFFEARRGKLHGFRFRDPFDFKSCAPSASIAPTDQVMGEGDGETVAFQLVKAYGDYARPIVKPVAAGVRVAVDGEEIEAFEVNGTTGMVTLEEAQAEGAVISAGFHFDTSVRFDIDRLDLSLDGFGAGRAISVPMVEILI